MKKLPLKVKLYALVISLLLVMGVSMMVTAQLSLSQMENRLAEDTSTLVQDIVMDRLSATAGEYGEQVSGKFNAAFKVPGIVRNIIQENIAADSSARISRSALSDAVRAVLVAEQDLSTIYAQFEANAYDGQDRYFTGDVEDHSTSTGTLEIYYFRDRNGDIQFERVRKNTMTPGTNLVPARLSGISARWKPKVPALWNRTTMRLKTATANW